MMEREGEERQPQQGEQRRPGERAHQELEERHPYLPEERRGQGARGHQKESGLRRCGSEARRRGW